MMDDVRKAVGFINALDVAGIDINILRDTVFRVSLHDAGLIVTRLIEAATTGSPTEDQQALLAVFGPRGDDRHA